MLLAGGEFLMGSEDRFAIRTTARGLCVGRGESVLDRRVRGLERRLSPFRRSDAIRDGGGALRLVVRLRRFLAGRLSADPGRCERAWWRQVEGADWRHPEALSPISRDARIIPWFMSRGTTRSRSARGAASASPLRQSGNSPQRGGLEGKAFPWGDDLEPAGEHRMNVWQGSFPNENTRDDGYFGTCPVHEFPGNGYGLHNTTGNMWEWTLDWFQPQFEPTTSPEIRQGPLGAHKVQKGGSHICHESYCRRYRVAARQGNDPTARRGISASAARGCGR